MCRGGRVQPVLWVLWGGEGPRARPLCKGAQGPGARGVQGPRANTCKVLAKAI